MDPKLIEALFTAYPLDSIPMDVLMIIGLICFLKLPKEKRTNIHFYLPFTILTFTFLYENFGSYTNYNFEFKKSVNEYLGNYKYPKFNLWLFNVAQRQIGTILYLFLIKSWLEPSKKKYINWMICLFILVASYLQFTGKEPIYLNQPIIFAIGANMILIGSALYFTAMITHPQYLNKNPLRLLSFWQMTFVMFTFTLTYISSVALIYLYETDPVLGAALQQIDRVMKIINLSTLTLTIASPFLKGVFEEEPFYVSHKTMG